MYSFLFLVWALSMWAYRPDLWLFQPPAPPVLRTVNAPITGPGLMEPRR
jgi:hypothetical protein